jgi:hypothetical protein
MKKVKEVTNLPRACWRGVSSPRVPGCSAGSARCGWPFESWVSQGGLPWR